MKKGYSNFPSQKSPQAQPIPEDFSKLESIPVEYQKIHDFYSRRKLVQPLDLRLETFRRIEAVTQRPLICYVARTTDLKPGMANSIDDSDITGFSDLISSVTGDKVDVLLVSNGGSPETAERIVCLLRERFTEEVRFIVPANAYSAATLICLSGDW